MNNFNEVLMKILVSREDRAKKQRELIKKYNSTLVSFTLNIPGATKDSSLYRKVHHEGMIAIADCLKREKFKVLCEEVMHKETGTEGYICVHMDAINIKRLMVEIEENHNLGRIFDIDTIDKAYHLISRDEINIEKRKCLLCDEEAKVCQRTKNHSINELVCRINNLAKTYFDK